MWFWLALISALFLGLYDVAKKKALEANGVLYVLLATTAMSCALLSPFFKAGPLVDHILLMLKAVLVTVSWIAGLIALRCLPLTTASTLKATRPMFVVLFSIILFGERLNGWQWGGVIVILASMFLLNKSSRKEGIDFLKNKGFYAMLVSILFGAASALYDKKLLFDMEPLFVQCWANFYIMVLLALVVGAKCLLQKGHLERFRWDWTLVLIAVLIVSADFLYFSALKQEGALLSIISLLRRCSVIVTFGVGAILFKEKLVLKKGIVLFCLLFGMALLLLGTI